MTPELKHQICTLKSQTEIAVALGTKPQTVSLWLSGQVPANRVIPLCRVLEWSITPIRCAVISTQIQQTVYHVRGPKHADTYFSE